MVAMTANLWAGLRAHPWDEKQVPKLRPPHPEPTLPGQAGDWLAEYGITSFPPAPQGWKLAQHLAEGYGIHSRTGKPLKQPTRSLCLAYLHLSTARGATAILHLKAGVNAGGADAWRFSEGWRWDLCTEPDCEHDRNHLTADLLREVGATEIKALLSEGMT